VRIGDFGQPRVEAHLEGLLERGRAAGTFLFDGPPGSGKEAVAVELGRLLNCERPSSPCPARPPFTRAGAKQPAERCVSCRKFDLLQHPDLLFVFPVPVDTWDEPMVNKESGRSDTLGRILQEKARNPYFRADDFERPASIQAEVLRDKVLSAAYNRPVEARVKTIVLSEIDSITRDSANILLKTLEEPPANCLLVLTTAVPQRILPTILSRSQRVHFVPLDPQWMEPRLAALSGAAAKDVRFAVAMSQGSMLAANRFLGQEQRAVRDRAFEILAFAAEDRELELLETAQTLQQGHAKQRHVVPSLLQMLAAAARDALFVDAGVAGRPGGAAGKDAAALVYSDRAAEIASAARAFGPAGLRALLRGAQDAEYQITRNAAVEHTLAAFFLDLARAAGQNAAPARRRS